MPAPQVARLDVDVPGYHVVARIGTGGFGEVFHARHAVIGRDVAIKVVHAHHCADPAAVARFLAEARAVNQIAHPNIVEIHDIGELADGRPYCVMELLRGRTLRAVLDERGRLSLDEATPILRGIAEAIDAAHAAGIIHRDLKPDNVFVLPDGSIKLIDFGLAKLTAEDASITQTGQVFGTPLYMSPEQCRGRGITPATDAYSFGVVAYHALVGAPPFAGEALDLAIQHINDAAPRPRMQRPELPARVDAVVLALLAKDPADRPANMVTTVAQLTGERAPPRRSRRGALAILAVALAGAGAIAVWIAARDGAPPAPVAERWSSRTIRIDLDGITAMPSVSRDGASLLYGDDAGWWRRDLASGRTERLALPLDAHEVTNLEELPGGELLVGLADPRATEIVDPRDGSRRRIADAGLPSISPDGASVAAWDAAQWLVVVDVATGDTRKLFQLEEGLVDSAPRWSPDGRQLLWGRGGYTEHDAYGPYRTFVTSVRDGETAPLRDAADVPYLGTTTSDYYGAIAFLPDGRIAYCNAQPAEVRTRALWGGAPSTVAVLDPTASHCSVAVRGAGLVITVSHSQTTAGVLELRRAPGQPAVFRQIAGPVHVRPVAIDEGHVYGYVSSGQLDAIDLDSGTITELATCPGEQRAVRRGADLLRVVIDSTAEAARVRFLRAGDCAVVDEWSLPPASRIGRPDCQPAWCAIAIGGTDRATVWRLEHEHPPVELAHVAVPGAMHLPLAAISHDGREVALAISQSRSPAIYLVPASGGALRRVPIDAGYLDGIAWAGDGRLLVSGQAIDGAPYALVAVARDGQRESIWSAKSTYLADLFTDPTQTRLAGTTSTWQQEFLLLDPAP